MSIARGDRARRRLATAFAGAFMVHAFFAWWGDRLDRGATTERSNALAIAQMGETEVDLLTTEDAPPPIAHIEQTNEPDQSRSLQGSLAKAHGRHSVPSAPSSGGGSAEAQGDSKSSGESPGDGYEVDPSAAPSGGSPGSPTIDLGIGAGSWSRYVDPRGTPSADPPQREAMRAAPASSTGGVLEALEAHDQKVGIGPAGAVLTAIHQVGYSDAAPALGTAIFSITVSRSGSVEVELKAASSRPAEWAVMGESIAAAIRKKPPRISAGRNGVRLGIEVVAEERWPNGQKSRGEGPALTVSGGSFKTVETAREELLDRNPAAIPTPDAPSGQPKIQANFSTPTIGVKGRGKVCSYQVGLSLIPISGNCDPTNIGQPARRVVSTRVVTQTMF